ncbi:MAG: methyl-accepting chemotaxis protein [Brevinematia bacterium]
MNFVSKITKRVILATFASIFFCNVVYTFLIPVVMNFSTEVTFEFYRKMIIVTLLISPLAVLCVYFFYLPIKKALIEKEKNGEVKEKILLKAQKAFNNIPNFLFFVGAIAYVLGLIFNFSLDIIKGHPLEIDNLISRFFTAISWGILNGIVAARVLNLVMIDAKLRLNIVDFSQLKSFHRVNSSFRFFTSGLIFFIFLVSFTGVVFYQQVKALCDKYIYQKELVKEEILSKFLISDFSKVIIILFILFIIVIILYGIIVYEISKNIKNIYEQLKLLTKDEMDLTQRIKIVSFDDIGEISARFNEFLNKLVSTVRNIKELSQRVFENSSRTKLSLEECNQKIDDLSKMMKEIENMARVQGEIVRSGINVAHNFVSELDDSINLINEQTVSVENTAKSIKYMWNSIEMISSKISEMKGFIDRLSNLISEGSQNVEKTLKSSVEIQSTGDNVSEIAKMIEDIAEQSGILAMNAAIEAAHAKEFGVGFAVVAQEMRKLALSTSESTRNIKSLMEEMKKKNSEGLKVSNELKNNFQNLMEEFKNNEIKFNEINRLVTEETNTARAGLEELNTLLNTTSKLEEHTKIMRESHSSLEELVTNLNKTAENLSVIQKDLDKGIKYIVEAFKNIYYSFEVSFEAINLLQKDIEKYKVE